MNKVQQDSDQGTRLELPQYKAKNVSLRQDQARQHEKRMEHYRIKCAQDNDLNKKEIPQLLALLIVIVSDLDYWATITRVGSMPKGVTELKNYLDQCLDTMNVRERDVTHLQEIECAISQQPLSVLISMLSSLATIANNFYSKDHFEFHQIFRGRDPKVNNFYGIISGLTQHGFAGGSAYYTARQRYFPNAALHYLKAEFENLLASSPSHTL